MNEITLTRFIEIMKHTSQSPDFYRFNPSIEKQLAKGVPSKLYWQKDVSGGNGQAILSMWTKITPTQKEN